MMKKEGKTRIHVNRWFKRFDLEDTVYRPFISLLLKGLGFVALGADRLLEGVLLPCGVSLLAFLVRTADRFLDGWLLPGLTKAVAAAAAGFDAVFDRYLIPAMISVGTFFGRVFDNVTDAVALALKNTAFRLIRPSRGPTVGNRFTYALGNFLDRCAALLNRTVLRSHPIRTRFVPALAAAREDAEENVKHFTRTLSFSLLLFALGLLLVLVAVRVF